MPRAADRRRQVAHYGAPALFLLAVTIAVLLIRAGLHSGSPAPSTSTASVTQPTTTGPTRKPKPSPTAQYYTVQTGDTFGSISAKTGVPIAQLEQLNPGVGSTSLQVGQKLRVK